MMQVAVGLTAAGVSMPFDLVDVPTDASHTVSVATRHLHLRFVYRDPRNDELKPMPTGVLVQLMAQEQGRPSRVVAEGVTDTDGRVRLVSATHESTFLRLDFGDDVFVDLEAGNLVLGTDLAGNDPRPLMGVPTVWDSRQQPSFSDARSGRFLDGVLAELQPDGQGNDDDPWQLVVDHAWDRVFLKWEYQPPFLMRGSMSPPPGMRIEAFNASKLSVANRVAAGYQIQDGLVCLWVHKPTPRDELRIRASTAPNSWAVWVSTKVDLYHRMVVRDPERLSRIQKVRWYGMPQRWFARGQFARFGAANGKFEELIANPTSAQGPLTFDLDDFVLADNRGREALAFSRPRRVAVLDQHLRVLDPDSKKEPYLTKGEFPANQFSGRKHIEDIGGVDRRATVIRRGSRFYNLTYQRCERGLVGARLAVRDDHPHESIRNPLRIGAGNFELRYFDCIREEDGEAVGMLLVYWSCRFRKIGGPKGSEVTSAVIAEFKLALENARKRWEGIPLAGSTRDYEIRPRVAPGAPMSSLKVGVRYHFAAFDDRQAKTVVTIRNPDPKFRDNMGVTEGNFEMPTRIVDEEYLSQDYYQGTFAESVLAHEIGHALGLDDEYLELIKHSSLPLFNQRGIFARPYGWDEGLMNTNLFPRMRYHAFFAWWLGKNESVKKLLGSQVYDVHHEDATGRKFVYAAPQDGPVRGFRLQRPIKVERNFKNGNRTLGLALYHIGDTPCAVTDRFIKFTPLRKEFSMDSLLVVRMLIEYEATKNRDGDEYSAPDLRDEIGYVSSLLVDSATPARYGDMSYVFMASNDDALFSKVGLLFETRFRKRRTSNHVAIRLFPAKFDENGCCVDTDAPRFEGAEATFSSDFFDVYDLQRFMLGIAFPRRPHSDVAGDSAFLTDQDLHPIIGWLEKTTSNKYAVVERFSR